MNQINIKQIKYKKKLVLEKSSIKVSNNGICLINGANGCGKTSLAKHLVKTNHNLISYMMQNDDVLIKELSVLENISLNQISMNQIENMLKELDLEYLINVKEVNKLSGGEKRIISFLRTLFSDAPIIILDEPTNDIDSDMKEKIIYLIEQISKYKYVIVITHLSCFKNYKFKYVIEDKKLKLLNSKIKIDNKKNYFNKRKLNKFYFEKQNYLYVLLPLFLLIFIFYSLYNFELEKYNPSIKDNSIRITTYMATDVDISESFDTSLLKCLDLKNTKKCLDSSLFLNNRNFTNDININEKYEHYVLEYYDEEKRQYHNIKNSIEEDLSDNFKYNVKLKYSLTNLLFNNNKNIIFLPKDFKDNNYIRKVKKLGFTIKKHDSEKMLVSFNNKFFKDYSSKFSNFNKIDVLINNNKKIYFIDFIIDNGFEKNILLLKNKDTDKLFYELNQLVGVKSFIKMIVMPYILVYLLLIVVIMFLIKAQVNKNRILYNYGFELKKIYKQIIHKYRIMFHDIFVLIISLIIIVFTYLKFENYLLTIVSISIVFFSILISNLIRFLIRFNLERMSR